MFEKRSAIEAKVGATTYILLNINSNVKVSNLLNVNELVIISHLTVNVHKNHKNKIYIDTKILKVTNTNLTLLHFVLLLFCII